MFKVYELCAGPSLELRQKDREASAETCSPGMTVNTQVNHYHPACSGRTAG